MLLVSHDRAFVDAVVTQTLVAEGGGHWGEYVGGYSDWLNHRATRVEATRARDDTRTKPGEAAPAVARTPRAKLSYKETRELAALPGEIEALETEQSQLAALMATADYHRRGAEQLKLDSSRLDELPKLIEKKLERWESLEARASG